MKLKICTFLKIFENFLFLEKYQQKRQKKKKNLKKEAYEQ